MSAKNLKSVNTAALESEVKPLSDEEQIAALRTAYESQRGILPDDILNGLIASAGKTILAKRNDVLNLELESLEKRRSEIMKWQCDNGFRTVTVEKEKGERKPCACGVGRHTENTAKCSHYIAFLKSEIAESKNEQRITQLRSYLAREEAKDTVVAKAS